MKDFFIYFFGAGTEVEFSLFTVAHFAPVVFAIGLILLIRRHRDALRSWKYEENLRYCLCFALLISDMAYYWRLVGGAPWLNPNPIDNLPIGVCGWAVIFCSFMVIGKKQSLLDIA